MYSLKVAYLKKTGLKILLSKVSYKSVSYKKTCMVLSQTAFCLKTISTYKMNMRETRTEITDRCFADLYY